MPGTVAATAGTTSTVGYATAGSIVARAGTQAGIISVNPIDQATYDPFGSTDPNVVQMLELLCMVGEELVARVNGHIRKEVTITTAGSATSWLMPPDFVSLVDSTGWDRTGSTPMFGAVSPQHAALIKAWTGTSVVYLPFRLEGNLMTFPTAPADGLTLAFEYVSNYWVQTTPAGPDASMPTAFTDLICFDPLTVVLGLKYRFLEAKGKSTVTAYTAFEDRLEWFKGKVAGTRVVSMSGSGDFSSDLTVPDTGYGVP